MSKTKQGATAKTFVFDGEEMTLEQFFKLVEDETDVSFIPEIPGNQPVTGVVFNLVWKMRLTDWQFHADDACPQLGTKASVRFVRWPKAGGEPVTGACEDALSPVAVCIAAVRAVRNWHKKYKYED